MPVSYKTRFAPPLSAQKPVKQSKYNFWNLALSEASLVALAVSAFAVLYFACYYK